MNIEHLSVSRVQCYESCQYKYKLRYHLKVPVPGPEKPWFNYGKIIHSIIEIYTLNKGKIPLNDIAKEVLDNSPQLSYNYRARLPSDLESFKSIAKKIGTDGEVEMEFNKDLEPPNNKIITGVIDRLFERNGTYYIFDWKTTKIGIHQKTFDNIITDLQLQVYAHIVSEKMKVPASKIKCSLYYFQGSKLVPVSFSQSTIDSVPSRLLKIYNEILEFPPESASGTGIATDQCGLCDYKTICPFFINK